MSRQPTLLAAVVLLAAIGSSVTTSVAAPTKASPTAGSRILGTQTASVWLPSGYVFHTPHGPNIHHPDPRPPKVFHPVRPHPQLPGPLSGGSTPPTPGSKPMPVPNPGTFPPSPGTFPPGGKGPVVVVTPSSPVVVAPTSVGEQPRFVANRFAAVGPPATSAPCNCLTKQYLADGSVVFQDLCTKEVAIAGPAAQAQGGAPAAQ